VFAVDVVEGLARGDISGGELLEAEFGRDVKA